MKRFAFLPLLFVCLPLTVAAQDRVVVTAATAMVYADPDFDAPVLTELARGTVVEVLERRPPWLRVLAADRVGFLHNALSEDLVSGPQRAAPTAPGPRAPAAVASPEQVTLVERKSPGTARLFAFLITGGGHLYAGETTKGLTLMGISAAAWIVGVNASTSSCSFSQFGSSCSTDLAPLYLGAGVAAVTWIYGIIDADDAARRANERSRGALFGARPIVGPGRDGSTRLGVSVPLPSF